MKNFSLILLSLLSISLFSCKENPANRVKKENLELAKERDSKDVAGLPKLTFKTKEFDFGTIKQGEKADANFEYENTGETDLYITDAKTSCGCTVANYKKNEPIKPGEKGVIKAVFDSKGKSNKQSKTITLITNTLEGQEKLTVKGTVTPDPNGKK
jgi:hypothetical protein